MPEPRDAGRSTLSLLFRSPLGISVLCPLSLAATSLLLGVLWEPNRVRLWHLLMGVQTALWVVSVFVVLEDDRSHRLDRPGGRSEWTAVVLCTLIAGGMSAFPFLGQIITQQWDTLPVELEAMLQLPHLRARFSILGLLTAAFTTLHTAGMLNVHVQLLAYPREPAARRGGPKAAGVDDEVLHYQRLRSRLERFLVFSAATLGVATLSLGAFRDLLAEFAPSLGELLEPWRIMSYGVYYTGILASVYLPTRKTLTEVGEALAARLVPSSPAEGTSWKDWSLEQEAVRTWLGLRGTALQDFQQALSVLAPLLASLSALALGAGG